MNNYIIDYERCIRTGTMAASIEVKTLYKKLVQGISEGSLIYNHKKAMKPINFIENFCHHSAGRSDLLKLELWQKAALSAIFGIVDENGNRVYREVFLVVGRKNGKSLLASAIIAYMAYIDGEYGAEIYCLAPKLDQASLVFNAFYQMIQKEPELEELSKKRRSDIYIADTNTTVKPIAFTAKKSDGFNPH